MDVPLSAPVPTVDAVAAEVRLVVGRVRSPAGLGELDLPVLDGLAGGRDAVPHLLAAAVARVDNDPYRTFLSVLLPFPFTPAAPWEQLGPNRRSEGRGERASREAFGLSWDACNRPGQLLDGRSRRDWAERFLAESILGAAESPGVDPEIAEQSVGTPAAPVEDPPAEGSVGGTHADADAGTGTGAAAATIVEEGPSIGRRRSLVAASAALVLLVVAGLVVALAVRESDDAASPSSALAASDGTATQVEGETTTAERRPCTSIGSLDADASMEPNAAELTLHFVRRYQSLPAGVGCPERSAFVWQELVVQEYLADGDVLPSAILVQRSTGLTVYLTPEAYATYRRLGSGDGSIAQRLGGMPAEVVTAEDGHQEVQLSKGVLLVAETAGAPFFWVPADFVELYRSSPGIGRPVSNPLPDLVQDYQYAVGEIIDRAGVPDLTPVADPGAELPDIEQLERSVVRQADGTAWWIGEDGRRYWIPDGGVWACLVGGNGRDVPEMRAYAIAALPFGGHATCSMD